jgi:hypothetical protein
MIEVTSLGLSLLVVNMRWPSINAFDRAFSILCLFLPV